MAGVWQAAQRSRLTVWQLGMSLPTTSQPYQGNTAD